MRVTDILVAYVRRNRGRMMQNGIVPMAQEIRPFLKINDSFKKIVVTSDTPKPIYNENGILIINVFDFLLNANSLDL